MSYLYFWKEGNAYRFDFANGSFRKEVACINGLSAISSVKNNGTVTININLDAIDYTIGNRRMVENFELFLVENNITELTHMSGAFKVFVDTVIYDASRNIIDEGVKIHAIDGKFKILPLEISSNDELEYVLVKNFDFHIPYMFPTIASGITIQRKVPRFIRIRNISIVAGFLNESTHDSVKILNQTLLDHTISPLSPTITAAKEDGIVIFNADNIGIIDLIECPRTIDLSLNISVGGFAQVYDDSKIIKILTDNALLNPDKPSEPVEPDTPGGCHCEEDKFFEKYERSNSNNPNAGLVVNDEDYENEKYDGIAYPYSKVVVDIPDITIGEYVEYVRSLVLMSL